MIDTLAPRHSETGSGALLPSQAAYRKPTLTGLTTPERSRPGTVE